MVATLGASRTLLLPGRPASLRLLTSTTTPYRTTLRASSTFPSRQKPPSKHSTTPGQPPTMPYSTTPSPPHGKYTYHLAASYIAKSRPFDPQTHLFQFNPYNRLQTQPKPGSKRPKSSRPESGQDAFFISQLGPSASSGEVALGVADGVGGWMDSGVDPADFSHAFCDYMASTASTSTPPPTARQLMQAGYEAVCHDQSIKAGGSTAIVGLLKSNGKLEVANLGDSGFILLRLNGVHASSEPQTHAFNTPYQLSVVPPSMLLRAAAFGGAQLMDQPRDAEVIRHGLKHGDVVVFASDGLWDNLFEGDILRIVSEVMKRSGAWRLNGERGCVVEEDLTSVTETKEGVTLQGMLATEIVRQAKLASMDPKLDGPFAKEVKKYYPHEVWRGGKEDDICVVVAVVEEEGAPVKAKL
ncbi:phosphatase 2C-like domain-containing protein [Triangularia verruculosa]|uniref:Protein phosphatase n=1 Tax=Triangularia verruculosa TaxID=2587418 RepID=A0AAN7AWS5_9PEZI|nr:phosphatase 2C-like domain-containing protein [Triangularia verruculosa]